MITSVCANRLDRIRSETHGHCIVCSPGNPIGFGLEFKTADDGAVEAVFRSCRAHEGYAGFVHGGVISALVDGAMTNCLFAHGTIAFTAELNVRFRHPIRVETAVTVRAWIEKSWKSLHVVRAELRQEGEVKAAATGKFLKKISLRNPDGIRNRRTAGGRP